MYPIRTRGLFILHTHSKRLERVEWVRDDDRRRRSCNAKHGKAILLTLGLAVSMSVARAAEKTLEFQLVSKALDPQILEAPNIENQTIMQSKGFGVAVFKDGRVGTKDYILTRDANKGVGTLVGYSTYYFDDGSVTARFTATIGGPQGTHGDYRILGGAGAYAGATGTGTFDSVPNPFKNANLYKAKLQIITP